MCGKRYQCLFQLLKVLKGELNIRRPKSPKLRWYYSKEKGKAWNFGQAQNWKRERTQERKREQGNIDKKKSLRVRSPPVVRRSSCVLNCLRFLSPPRRSCCNLQRISRQDFGTQTTTWIGPPYGLFSRSLVLSPEEARHWHRQSSRVILRISLTYIEENQGHVPRRQSFTCCLPRQKQNT